MKRLLPSLLFTVLLLTACSTASRKTFDNSTYTFTYPAGWKTMAEISPEYQSGNNYFWLGTAEEVTVTSADEAGGAGISFAVAARSELFFASMKTFPVWSYAILEDDIRGLNQAPVTISEREGVRYHYNRLWNENWYQFQDYWVEQGPLLYLLSFHAEDLSRYQREIDRIVDSFVLK